MIDTVVTPQAEKQIARPLHVLVPLIQKDLDEGRVAAMHAAMPHYRAAGKKMLEAKAQLQHGEFGPWLKRNFKVGARQAREYMALADAVKDYNDQNGGALPFSSISDFVRKTRNPNYNRPNAAGVDTLNRWKAEIGRIQREEVKRIEDGEAQRKLALQIINIGYKALATKLHPDKGGSPDAMTRLNQARDFLKHLTGRR